jgi:hypothetical protein
MGSLLGPVRQVGYVVKDIHAAMTHWIGLGVGPWFYQKDAGGLEFRYYGRPSPLPKLSIAIANSGEMQMELIQQRNDAPTLYRDTLRRNGECAQHVAYWTADRFDELSRGLRERGYVEGHAGRMSPSRGPFAYFLRPDFPSLMIELTDLTGGKAEYYADVRQAALEWDGSNPIRHVGTPT